MRIFGVGGYKIFHLPRGEVWQSRFLFTCCHAESRYLRSIDKAF